MKTIKVALLSCVVLFGFSIASYAYDIVCGGTTRCRIPGDGGDIDTTTYHFDSGNVDFQMTKRNLIPITISEVATLYGTLDGMTIYNDGREYVLSNGLKPVGADLSGTNWTDSSYPSQGNVAIDPATGRFKFSLQDQAPKIWQQAQLIEDNVGFDADNTGFDVDEYGPKIVISGSNAVAVWRQCDTTGMRIYSNYSTDGGKSWGTDQLIEDNTGFNAGGPIVAISGSNVVAVWWQADGSNDHIYSNYSNDGGKTWGKDQLIGDNIGYSEYHLYHPRVAISGSNVVAIWRQSDGSNFHIYSNYSNDGGKTWGVAQLIEDNAGFDAGEPQIATSDSHVVAVWYQGDGISSRIYSNYSNDGGKTWTGDRLLEDNAGLSQINPQVAMSGSNAVAVWEQYILGNNPVYFNYSSDYGQSWAGDQFLKDVGGYYYVKHPQLAISGSNVVAMWHSGKFYSNYSIDGGKTWGTAQVLEDISFSYYLPFYPQVAISGSNVVVIWCEWDKEEAAPYTSATAYSKYSLDGGKTWSTYQLLEDSRYDVGAPHIAISDSHVVAAWSQGDGTNERIYSNYGLYKLNVDYVQTNRPPVLTPIGNKEVNEGSLLQFTISATDPDRDTLTYSITNKPHGAKFNTKTGRFRWIPDYNQAGTYKDIKFTVTDGSLTDEETITITVNNTNRSPKIQPIGNKTVNEGRLLQFTVQATDPDGDPITYSMLNAPSGATINPQTGQFNWTPDYKQAGNYVVTFVASDGSASSGKTITITVKNITKPDLVCGNISHSPLYPKAGHNVTFKAPIKNVGKLKAGRFTVSFNIAGTTKTTTVYSLYPKKTTNVTFVWKAKKGAYTATVTADSKNVIQEMDETNNTATKEINVK